MDGLQNGFYSQTKSQEELIALRDFLGRDPCAARFGAETHSDLLYVKGHPSHRIDPCEIECLLDALRVEGEVLP